MRSWLFLESFAVRYTFETVVCLHSVEQRDAERDQVLLGVVLKSKSELKES
jgi:hypothetical protein